MYLRLIGFGALFQFGNGPPVFVLIVEPGKNVDGVVPVGPVGIVTVVAVVVESVVAGQGGKISKPQKRQFCPWPPYLTKKF